MAAHTNIQFPSDTTTLSTLSVCPLPFPQPTARGPDGLRAAYFLFPEVTITAQADQEYQPVAAVTVYDCRIDSTSSAPPGPPGSGGTPTGGCGRFAICGALPMGVDAMDRISWWLNDVGYVNDPLGSMAAPPDFDYEIRAALGRRAERVADGTSALTAYGNNGLFIQVSGILCTEFEIWARINPFQIGITVGTQITVRFGAVVDRNSGSLLNSGVAPVGVIGVLKGELGNG